MIAVSMGHQDMGQFTPQILEGSAYRSLVRGRVYQNGAIRLVSP